MKGRRSNRSRRAKAYAKEWLVMKAVQARIQQAAPLKAAGQRTGKEALAG